jgi:hypothetical protein
MTNHVSNGDVSAESPQRAFTQRPVLVPCRPPRASRTGRARCSESIDALAHGTRDPGESNPQLSLLGGGERVEHQPSHLLDVLRSAVLHLVEAGVRQGRERVSTVVRVGASGDPCVPFEPDHHLRQPWLRAVALCRQVAEPHGQRLCHREAGKDAVLEVRDARVSLQLTVQQGREADHDGEELLPHLLLLVVEPGRGVGHGVILLEQATVASVPLVLGRPRNHVDLTCLGNLAMLVRGCLGK